MTDPVAIVVDAFVDVGVGSEEAPPPQALSNGINKAPSP
jgi:hypothetical protein